MTATDLIQNAIAESLANNGALVTVTAPRETAEALREIASRPVNGWKHRLRFRRTDDGASAGGFTEAGDYWRVRVAFA